MDSLLSGTTNTRCDDNELSIVMKKHPSLQNLISPDITYTSEMLVDGGDAAAVIVVTAAKTAIGIAEPVVKTDVHARNQNKIKTIYY